MFNLDLSVGTEISITCKDKLPKQFALAKLLKSHDILGIIRVRYVNPYKVLVQFDNETSAERLISTVAIHELLGWRCQKTYEVGVSYGIIKDVDLDLNEKDMIESMTCGVEIVSVKRLSRKSSDESGWKDSETVSF